MTFVTTFTHTDGRVFDFVETVPHTTRDGREVTLKAWRTCCSTPGCAKALIVRTATETPQTWENFEPAKFCGQHRKLARARAAQARNDGLHRWLESPEGQAARAARLGGVERAAMEAVQGLVLADGAALVDDVYAAALALMKAPPADARDTRQYRLKRALDSLIEKGRLAYRAGVFTLT